VQSSQYIITTKGVIFFFTLRQNRAQIPKQTLSSVIHFLVLIIKNFYQRGS